jgi:hypothetical protein
MDADSVDTCVWKRMLFGCSICTLAADRPKKKVQLAVDVVVRAPLDEPQQALIIMVSGRA